MESVVVFISDPNTTKTKMEKFVALNILTVQSFSGRINIKFTVSAVQVHSNYICLKVTIYIVTAH